MCRFPTVSVFMVLLLAACGDVEFSMELSGNIPVDTLRLGDSIGVLTGDTSYVFGEIHDIARVPEGVAVLDASYCRLSFYSPEGDFLRSAGGRGEGPGEFTNPFWFSRMGDGKWFIYDFGGSSITVLDDTLGFVSSQQALRWMPLHTMAAGDSLVVMQYIAYEFVDEELHAGHRMTAVNVFTGQEEHVYREHLYVMGADTVEAGLEFCAFTVDMEGSIYAADYHSESYSIRKFSVDGTEAGSIEMPPEDRPPFDPEIHRIPFLPITAPLSTVSGTSVLRFSAPRQHPYVTGLAVDGQGNIWARRMGLADSEHWDVLSQEGELLRRVVLYADTTGSAEYPALHVSPWGMVATRIEYEMERFYLVR